MEIQFGVMPQMAGVFGITNVIMNEILNSSRILWLNILQWRSEGRREWGLRSKTDSSFSNRLELELLMHCFGLNGWDLERKFPERVPLLRCRSDWYEDEV